MRTRVFQVLALVLCLATTQATAQLTNDVCAGAIPLGTLATPNPCDGTPTEGQGAPTVTNGLTNVGGISENPYSTIVNCQGVVGNNMSSPATDVWYSFVATGNELVVNITGGLTTPNIGIYSGTCGALTPFGCDIGAAGTLNSTFPQLFPGTTYYIQISGGTVADQGVFNLTLTNNNSCNDCLVTSNLTATPAPSPTSNGVGYFSGQTVTFCYTVTDWIQQNTNWFQGIEITYGAGWDMTSLTNLVPAASCDGSGTWGYYPSITSTATGNTFGQGFYYDTGGDGIPGNNFGDNCGQGGTSVNPVVNWQFCWTITANSCPPGTTGDDLGLIINTVGDGESGSWSNLACVGDPNYIFSAGLICCTPPLMSNTNMSCNGVCDGTATAIGQGTAPFAYQWDAAAGNQTTSIATGLCAGTYTCTVTDANGCITTGTVTVAEPAAITLTPSNTPSTCGQPDGSVSVTANGGTVAVDYTYLWEDATPSTIGNTATVNGLSAGTYTITVTDDNGCTATGTTTITTGGAGTAAAAVTSNYNGEDISCNGACDGEVTVTMTGGNAPFTYDLGGPGQASNIFSTECAGTYTVTVVDVAGCITTTTITLTEPTPVTLTPVTVDEVCLGDCSGSIGLTAGGGVPTYQYSNDNCATMQAGTTFNGLCAGAYTVCTQDLNGCPATAVVNILPGAPLADATITPVGPFCIDDAPVVMNAATGGGTWSGTGMVGSSFDPATAGAGTHTITYMISTACGDTATTTVTVNPLPTVTFVADVTSGCEPLAVNFSNTGTAGSTCLWNFGDGTTSSSCGPVNHVYNNPGSYDVTLTITDANGCSSTTTVANYIQVFANPVASFGFGPQPATFLEPTINFTNTSTGEVSWNWNFDGQGSSTQENPSFNFPAVGSYDVELIVTSADGCMDTAVHTVIIVEDFQIFVPNAFTPDDDGRNEIFIPVMSGVNPDQYTLYVFDRWGHIIFESHAVNIGWDGRDNGKMAKSDVYVWKIVLRDQSDKKHEYIGHVTLLK